MRHRVALLAVVVLIATVTSVGAVGSTAAQETETLDCSFPFTATDATGTEVTVEEEPEEIVTLSPSAAQTMWEIGGEDKVVGVSKYATYLEGAEGKANVSGGGQTFVSQEKVVDLDPDLVLAPNTITNDTVEALRDAGLTVYRFPFQTSIEDIRDKTLRTGQLTGLCDGAEETVAWMDEELSTVDAAIEGVDRPRVLYVFFGFTAGEGTFAHRVIERAGGTNIAAEANITNYAEISEEVVVAQDPEWIVLNDGAPQVPRTEAYNNTHAVENNQTVVLREAYISQPAPRIVLSVVKLAETFHPEAYEDAAMETPTRTTASASPSTSPTDTPSAPGYGIGVALVALLVTATLLERGLE